MADFKDPKSGKQYRIDSISSISASIAAGNLVDGRKYEFVGIDKVPVRAKQLDQSIFHNLDKIDTGSVMRDTVRGTVIVPYKKKFFKENLIDAVSASFTTTQAFLQVSASIAAKFLPGISDDFLIGYNVEEFYTASDGPSGSFVGPVTASMNSFTPDGLTSSFSGIDTGNGYDMTFNFSGSHFVTNQLIAFSPGNSTDILRIATFIPKFQHKFINSGSRLTPASNITVNKALITSSLASVNGVLGLNAAAVSPPSGSNCGIGTIININGTNVNNGTYSSNMFKGRVGGDGDSGSLAATNDGLLPNREYIIYPTGTTVASGSFRYFADTGNSASLGTSNSRREIINATTASNDIRTLFYAEALTGVSNGPSGSHTGSRFLGGSGLKDLGSPVHSDPLLQTTASIGFYAPLGHTAGDGCFEINTASFDNGGNDLVATEMMVPRIISKVTISGS